tara:strand:+ start:533 stop:1165 length:633 start_codon:yes stop_codon:yes gene_type:complete
MTNVEEQMSEPSGDEEETLESGNQSASKLDQEDTYENSDESRELELEAATVSSGQDQLAEKLAAAELAAEKARDDLLRVQAEMQNLRRRTEQDVERAHKYGIEKFSIELLVVADNLERALNSASESKDESAKAILDGVSLTLKSLNDCFAKFSIEVVDPLGEPFDPQLHQAIATQESPDSEPNSVIEVIQKGYTLNGRVIRPAMVMVSKG